MLSWAPVHLTAPGCSEEDKLPRDQDALVILSSSEDLTYRKGNQFSCQRFPRLQVLCSQDGVFEFFGQGDTECRATTIHTVRKPRLLQLDPSRTPTFRQKGNPDNFSIHPRAQTNSSTTSRPRQRSRLLSDTETPVRLPTAWLHLGFPTSLPLKRRHRM